MTTDIQTTETRDLARVAESLVTQGDISLLTPEERVRHYLRVCEAHGLNPTSLPFAFLRLNGREIMYANRSATDQLAAMHNVTREIIDGPKVIDLGGSKLVYAVCKASLPNGRFDTATATLPLADPVNVLMKCETKAKRRATLSLLGLGVLDEAETETIPGAVRVGARDDAPAQPAPVDALDAFRAALAGAESLDLDGARRIYAAHDLGGTSLSAVTVVVVGALAVRGYRLTGMEAGALLRGELPDALALAYDRLAAIDRHADDADGDGVVADVVRVLRASGSLPKAAKARLLKVAAQTIALELQVSDADAAARLDAALRPPPPPTGTDAPAANDAASAHGDAIAAAQTAGAQALRTVLDSDVAHITIAGTWRADPAQWEAHLAEKSVRRAVENSVACNGAALGPVFVALAAERIVALDALRPKPADARALTVIGVTQTLERIAYDASRQRAAAAAGEQRAA